MAAARNQTDFMERFYTNNGGEVHRELIPDHRELQPAAAGIARHPEFLHLCRLRDLHWDSAAGRQERLKRAGKRGMGTADRHILESRGWLAESRAVCGGAGPCEVL